MNQRFKLGPGLNLGLALVALLAACTTANESAGVAGLETALAAAETGAYSYASLPRCTGAGAATPCSQQAIVDQMKRDDMIAYGAVKSAEATTRAGGTPDIAGATAAITALQSIVGATAPKTGG